jgi:hypothetical protein
MLWNWIWQAESRGGNAIVPQLTLCRETVPALSIQSLLSLELSEQCKAIAIVLDLSPFSHYTDCQGSAAPFVRPFLLLLDFVFLFFYGQHHQCRTMVLTVTSRSLPWSM